MFFFSLHLSACLAEGLCHTARLIVMNLTQATEEPIKAWSGSESWGRKTNYFSPVLPLEERANGPGGRLGC